MRVGVLVQLVLGVSCLFVAMGLDLVLVGQPSIAVGVTRGINIELLRFGLYIYLLGLSVRWMNLGSTPFETEGNKTRKRVDVPIGLSKRRDHEAFLLLV
jgi:hypothetical protein